jgi:hypothetical protein
MRAQKISEPMYMRHQTSDMRQCCCNTGEAPQESPPTPQHCKAGRGGRATRLLDAGRLNWMHELLSLLEPGYLEVQGICCSGQACFATNHQNQSPVLLLCSA